MVLSNRTAQTLARVGCDQIFFAPLATGVFLVSMSVMEGGDPRHKMETTYWPALKSNWYLWPFAQMVNFSFVPLEHRLLFVNIVAIGWNCWLSFLNNRGAEADKKVE